MSKQTALARIKMMQKRGFNREFEQKPKSLLDKEVWFCVVYSSGNPSFAKYKELVKRLHNGEVIIRNGKKMMLCYGYGKFLGRMKFISRNIPAVQFVLYDTVKLSDSCSHRASGTYDTYHETWIRLGEWAKELLLREKVVFT